MQDSNSKKCQSILKSKSKSKDTKGHDLISNILLKAIKHEIVKRLTFMINQSLKTGTFPDRLKVGRVRSLFKKDNNQLITNYRLISILPSLSKIFEKVMHMQLTYYIYIYIYIIYKRLFQTLGPYVIKKIHIIILHSKYITVKKY